MKFIFPESEEIKSRAWKGDKLPEKVLFIRLHAFGDSLISFLAAEAFKKTFPNVELHLLICRNYSELPKNIIAFDKVHVLNNSRGGWPMALDLLKIYPELQREKFDSVVDLQNNIHSRTIRRSLLTGAWSQFDRYSRVHALQRYHNTINALGLKPVTEQIKISLRNDLSGLEKLMEKGWNGTDQLIFLNPCGAFPTRQWGQQNYLAFAQLWMKHVDSNAKFVLLGYPSFNQKTTILSEGLGTSCLNLIGQTNAIEAFNIIRNVNLSLSDDGGLMHASWTNNTPTIGFLGASPAYWGRPLGVKSVAYTSEDLECGNCHSMECKWGDNRCLTRVTPKEVVERAKQLLVYEINTN